MRRYYILSFFILLVVSVAFADVVRFLDSSEIQQYHGELGKWTLVASTAELNGLIKKYDTSIEKVREINGASFSIKDYIFIPYSDNYLKELEGKGIIRLTTKCAENDFMWPLAKVESISSSFGHRGGHFHPGADMPTQKGTPILAAMDGRIVFTGYTGGHGKTIFIEHRNDLYTRYSHCSAMLVKNGEYVKQGQIIGLVGSSGRSTGNHLHFEIRYKDIPLNPLDFLPINDKLKETHQMRSWK